MFGLSFAKLLLILLAAAVLWSVYKGAKRRELHRARAQRPPQPVAETMVKCPVCGTYNPSGVACTHRS
ncbi:MAG TPA: hypothetical protein VGO34_11200 [Alphaproteobacteria bacterium]|jgi:hypothetical protein